LRDPNIQFPRDGQWLFGCSSFVTFANETRLDYISNLKVASAIFVAAPFTEDCRCASLTTIDSQGDKP